MSRDNLNPQPRRKTRQTSPVKKQPPPPKPSFFTTQAIKVLRFTISLLEGTVEKLETSTDGRRQLNFVDRLVLGWGSFLDKIRSLLPTSLSRKLSNTALSGLITITLIAILGINIIAYNQNNTEIASATTPNTTTTITTTSEITVPIQEEKNQEITIPQDKSLPVTPEKVTSSTDTVESPEVNKPEINKPEVNKSQENKSEINKPEVNKSQENQAEKNEIIVPTEEKPEVKENISPDIPENIPPNIPANEPLIPNRENETEIAPEVENQPKEEKESEKKVEEIPVPTIELTPEEKLIASIKNQIENISDRLVNGVIQSVGVNFYNSTLTLKISDDWYTFEETEQNQLVADMFQRSKEVDFSHLEIIDSNKKLIARSPVVGTEMIIFRRSS